MEHLDLRTAERSAAPAGAALLFLLLSLVGAVGAFATSYVPMTDAALVDGAAIAVEVQVLGVEPAPDAAALSYLVEVERVLKGEVMGGTLVVHVPGGPAPGGGWFRVSGAPVLAAGERALLLLEPRADGAYGLSQMMLGAFHRVSAGGRQILVRDLREAEALEPVDRRRAARGASSSRAQVDPARDAEAFATWLAGHAAGAAVAPADYVVDLPSDVARSVARELSARRRSTLPERAPSSATSLLADDGLPVRWFDFDAGGTVELRAHDVPQHGWNGGTVRLEQALAAWNQVPGSKVALALAGATAADLGMRAPDGVNTVLWNDPHDEIPGSFSCSDGGVLAIGGNWYRSEVEKRQGQRYHPIAEGDVVLQDGASCYLENNEGVDGAEVLAHELGHLLGLGHGCGEVGLPACSEPRYGQSLMRPLLHGSGRGPAPAEDDLVGLLALYGEPTDLGGLGVFVPEGDFVLLGAAGEPTTLAYGLPGDLPVAGDWDGDGGDTVGIYRDGVFLLHAPHALADVAVPFGEPGDQPVAGDWDGDGIDTIGVYRDGVFRLRNSNTPGPADLVIEIGATGGVPVAGDLDGDGLDSVGVFQLSSGRFLMLDSLQPGAAAASFELGGAGGLPVVGDWDGDGVDAIGVYRDGVFTLAGEDSTLEVTIPAASGIPVAGRWERMR